MPENDPRVNAPHLTSRMAVPAGAYSPQPGIPERCAASAMEEMLAAGDAGGARHLVREIENGTGTWKDASPWRLLDHLLDLGMIRPREAAAAPGPDRAASEPASGAEGVTPS